MTKKQLWRVIIKRNPTLMAGTHALSPKGVRQFFDLVWDEAEKNTLKIEKDTAEVTDLLGRMGMK